MNRLAVSIVVLAWLIAASGASQGRADAPKRIIAMSPSNAEIVCALDAGDLLVGVSSFATYPPELETLPKIGGLTDPDLEAVIALRPDLILIRGNNVHLEQLAKSNGIRLYYDHTQSLESIFDTITELGALLERVDEAQTICKSMRQRLAEVRDRANGKPRPRVLVTLRSPDRLAKITTASKGTYLNSLMELAGGENVFADSEVCYPQVRLEQIVTRAPDIVIEAMPGESIDDDRRAALIEQWEPLGIPAARSPVRIHFITEDYALIPSPRLVLLAERLADIIHPASETDSGS